MLMRDSVHPLLRLLGLYRKHLWLTLVTALALACINLGHPLVQWLVGRALTDVEQGRAVVRLADGSLNASVAWWWVVILLGTTLVRGLAQYLVMPLAMIVGQRLLTTLRATILEAVQALDITWHQRHGAGEIINRTTRDSDKVRDAVVGGARSLLELGTITVGTLGLLCWYNPLLATVPALLLVISIWLVRRDAGRLVALDRAMGEAYDGVAQEISEGVSGVRVVKAFALEDSRNRRFGGLVDAFTARARTALSFTARRLPLPQLVVSLGHCWVLGCGGWLAMHGRMSLGELVAAMMVIQGFVFRVEAIGGLIRLFADASASAARIVELLDAVPAVPAGGQAPPDGPLTVEMEDVRVAVSGRPVLDGITLRLQPGEVVALVGITGSGKTTLATLLPRLRDPDSGRVLLNGIDARTCDAQLIRRRVQVAFQDPFLFSDTLAANLRLPRPEATDAELREALRLAAAEDVVAQLPDGLAGKVGERGVTLSGGQRQRICLARALVARPSVLVGDDATSALDAVTESLVLANLRATRGDLTVLLIASRPATCALADRVLLLVDGRIVASGTHIELAAHDARYRDLMGLA